MKLVAAFFLATLAVVSAGVAVPAIPLAAPAVGAPLLGAPLLPKVKYNAPEVSVVKQPVTVHEPEVRYRNVAVPYSVPYAVPYSVPYPVPVAHHAVAYTAPIVRYH
ncbi:hypothetical protein J437_LFUL012776 [Ladona fulva]|uniref:Uncharacterized protein n=1 Tax=Ladona fulva TaxID=123851 RepID=A0A8K0KE46_LADFU|nr:hypothetical protein J437_LFUL012776 [Ladona fulva]